MGLFADGSLSKAVCQRCGFKFSYQELMADGDVPGLRVCVYCRDNKDPWKLPPRQPDQIALKNPRPDIPFQPVPTWDSLYRWDFSDPYEWS